LIKIIFYLQILLYTGCTVKNEFQSAKVVKDGEEMLFGPVSAAQLFFDYPDWRIEYDNYQLDTTGISDWKNDSQLAVEIFFGTWCEDSQREVPRFLKLNDGMNLIPKDSIALYAVDREKQLDNDLCRVRNITRVSTFIFYKSGREIGRIVEYPRVTLEKDIESIIEYK
jgi:thiol-disulfide isomerase/thioredoxin